MEMIKKVFAREILDSYGVPTVEIELETERVIARVDIPSGLSTGIHEALELRDKDPKRYHGKGVLQAIENINTVIRNEFLYQDMQMLSQKDVDKKLILLDGTENKSRLGSNAILAFSLAFAKAKSFYMNVPLYKYFSSLPPSPSPLVIQFAEEKAAKAPKADPPVRPSAFVKDMIVIPVPLITMINGGKFTYSNIDFQEYMIIPIGAPSFKEAVRYGSEVFHTLRHICSEEGIMTASMGDTGGLIPRVKNNTEALDLIMHAIEKSGYKNGKNMCIGLNVDAADLYNPETKQYTFTVKDKPEQLTTAELQDYYIELLKKYPILSIEDPFDQNDWEGFSHFTRRMGKHVQVVGDNIFATNPKRIQQGIEQKAANSSLIKLNQIGTVTETVQSAYMSMDRHWTAIISHRSGETEDTTIVDLAIGLGTGQIKTGAPSRSERIAKYNQLMRIEEKERYAVYPGLKAFYNISL